MNKSLGVSLERGILMIDQLRKIYPSLYLYNEGIDNLTDDYKWFLTDTNVVIGILKKELTSKDTLLLTTFLTPYDIKIPTLTETEQRWKKVINLPERDIESEFPIHNRYRFVYFSINKNQITPSSFKEAIQEVFGNQVSILWENEYEGIIIENQLTLEDNTSYEQIIDILMSDLYVKIKFYVGPFQADLVDVHRHYLSLTQSARKLFTVSNKAVLTYVDAVPYLLIDQIDSHQRQDISQAVLQEYIDDEESLEMIEAFVQCNLNISETAKRLHMHRNSLQYRLDRFFEKTNIDIRQFHQAMTVYLALLAKE